MAHDARDAEQILTQRFRDTFVTVVVLCQREIQFGGPLSGAPGQPVDTGQLRNSWQREISGDRAMIGSPVEYAAAIEAGVGPHGPMKLKSAVGGFHSVKKVVAGIDRIYAAALRASEAAD